ncbi:MAG TPA: hypothetical protein VGL28_02600 [Steroidobacteraceae bacterium]|jgi:hypothetical protein
MDFEVGRLLRAAGEVVDDMVSSQKLITHRPRWIFSPIVMQEQRSVVGDSRTPQLAVALLCRARGSRAMEQLTVLPVSAADHGNVGVGGTLAPRVMLGVCERRSW